MTLGLFACLLVIGGVVASRAVSTVTTMQAQSTPPPIVNLSLDSGDEAVPVEVNDPGSTTADENAGQSIDTGPARDAVAEVGMDYQAAPSVLGSVGGLAEGAAEFSGVSEIDLKPMTILLMGVDARGSESIDIGVRPDSLGVLRLDPEAGTCRLLRIPRDSRVELPGYGMSKINHALAVGGIPYQQLVVDQFLGITIDNYALIDFSGIESLVDAVGGITITVDEPFQMDDITFEAGEQTLTGHEALTYARYRGGPDGDFGRIRRQQQIMTAILRQAGKGDVVTLAREVLPQVQDHIRTDFTVPELVAVGSHFRGSCTDETLVSITLDGTVATFDDPLFGVPLSYVVVNEADVRRKVEELMET